MKSLMLLWNGLAKELGQWCCTSTSRDFKTVTARCQNEGVSFLTITLPTFGKDFEKSLDLGYVAPTLFKSFSRRGEGLPVFLRGFLERVFDSETGRLVDEPDLDSIYAVRQLTLMFSKILVECSQERTDKAISDYINCEQEVNARTEMLRNEGLDDFRRVSLLLFRELFSKIDRDVYYGEIVPKHGPGATADKLKGNRKFDQLEWPDRMESVFPFGEYAIPSWRSYYILDRVNFLEPGAERPARVITVPKTLKTPRIIAIEPTCMQYMQQALMEKFVDYIQGDSLLGSMIGFDDQLPNQELARHGSLTGELATLDLSEASDRVSNLHVTTLFERFPSLSEGIQACRSVKADVPGYGVIPLSKFASMGSALTFPMEAIVFLTTIFMGIEKGLNRQLTLKDLINLKGSVRVFGDDIIIPVEYVRPVIEQLELLGFKVNAHKSFWTGKFRESCGKEFYAGHDVSVVRVRREFPSSQADVQEIISLVSLRNHLHFGGFVWPVVDLDRIIGKFLPHFPVVHPESPALGRHSLEHFDSDSWDDDLQKPLVKAFTVKTRTPASKVSGEGALLKWFLKRGEQPFADRDHLERQGRPQTVNIKLRGTSPF